MDFISYGCDGQLPSEISSRVISLQLMKQQINIQRKSGRLLCESFFRRTPRSGRIRTCAEWNIIVTESKTKKSSAGLMPHIKWLLMVECSLKFRSVCHNVFSLDFISFHMNMNDTTPCTIKIHLFNTQSVNKKMYLVSIFEQFA